MSELKYGAGLKGYNPGVNMPKCKSRLIVNSFGITSGFYENFTLFSQEAGWRLTIGMHTPGYPMAITSGTVLDPIDYVVSSQDQ